ncbi:MAG: ATP-binding cassette domain-containing protein [SAR324 cluster bacterium]|nr:ATP-binding cassette domain-containing protein [SAR324 cluster bacterium]
MIEVQGLRKTFKTVTALDGIEFEARDGEITGLIGPNGAGKTTALRILYTVMRPDEGAARIDGFDTVTAHLWMRRVLMRKKRQGNTRRTW